MKLLETRSLVRSKVFIRSPGVILHFFFLKKSLPVKPLVSVDGVNSLDVQGTEILNELKSRLPGLCSTKLLRAGYSSSYVCLCSKCGELVQNTGGRITFYFFTFNNVQQISIPQTKWFFGKT